MRRIIFALFLILLLPSLVFAQNQIYNKLYLNPYVLDSMNANQDYEYTLDVKPIDKIYEIKTAIINFNIYTTPSVNFTIKVNNQDCNTKSFFISTTYGSAGLYSPSFDCSNVIKTEGIYSVKLKSTKASSSSFGWADITYQNKQTQKLQVYGTEYLPNQNGTIFLQVEDWNKTKCELDIYYPNKTIMVSSPMTFLNNSRGIYYYDFIVPSKEGVYITDALCYKPIQNATITSYYGFNNPIYVVKGTPETTSSYYSYGNVGAGAEACQYFYDSPDTYDFIFSEIGTIYNHRLWLYSGATRTTQVRARYYKINDGTNTLTYIGEPAGQNFTTTATPTQFTLNSFYSNASLTTRERLVVQVCVKNFGNTIEYRLYFGGTTNSSFVRNTSALNQSQAFEYRGTAEIHITNSTTEKLNSIENKIDEINLTNNQILNKIDNMNLTLYQILNKIDEINLTTSQILVLAQKLNFSNEQILSALLEINLTTAQTKILAEQINLTTNQNSIKLNDILYDISKLNISLNNIKNDMNNNYVTTIGLLLLINTTLGNVQTITTEINLTTQQNQQLLNEIKQMIDGNLTIILEGLDNFPNASQIAQEILLSDVYEYSLDNPSYREGYSITGSIIGGVAYALPNDVISVCVNSTTLINTLKSVRCVNDVCVNIERNSTIECQYGCNDDIYPNQCNPAPFQTNILFFGILVILIVLMIIGLKLYK